MSKKLSLIQGISYTAFQVDGTTFFAAKFNHNNACLKSKLEVAPGLLPDPAFGGIGSAPLIQLYSWIPDPDLICAQVIEEIVLTLRFDAQKKQHVYVQDGHGHHIVRIVSV